MSLDGRGHGMKFRAGMIEFQGYIGFWSLEDQWALIQLSTFGVWEMVHQPWIATIVFSELIKDRFMALGRMHKSFQVHTSDSIVEQKREVETRD